MFIFGVITIATALLSSSTVTAFIPLPDPPFIGKLPLTDDVRSYDIAGILADHGIAPDSVSDILVYVFFTGLGGSTVGPPVRAFYELYTESTAGLQYKQYLNAVFNQRDTVMDSANLWIPYFDLATPGYLYAHKITAEDEQSRIQCAAVEEQSVTYKNLHEAMDAYVQGRDTVFRDIYLIGYSQ